MSPSCPQCGQSLPITRLGIKLTPLKARIFDLIKRGGKHGIAWDDLYSIMGFKARETLKAHVHQINEAIEDSGYRINGRGGSYRLVKINDYNSDKDFSRSIDVCYEAIRERVANGGPSWTPPIPTE